MKNANRKQIVSDARAVAAGMTDRQIEAMIAATRDCLPRLSTETGRAHAFIIIGIVKAAAKRRQNNAAARNWRTAAQTAGFTARFNNLPRAAPSPWMDAAASWLRGWDSCDLAIREDIARKQRA